MAHLLHISVSSRADQSISRDLGRRLVARLQAGHPERRVILRDLGTAPPPHPETDFVAASLMPEAERGPAEDRALAYSEMLIAELRDAAAVVIDTPMHNFTVPSALKAWIDHVVRKNRTFRSTPTGKVGLLADRPVHVVVACGGAFSDDPAVQRDFLTPYLTYLFAAIGIRSLDVLLLEKAGRGPAERAAALARAEAWIAARS